MAKARVYRQDTLCPICGSNWVKKDGHSRGKQQFKCNQCGKKHQEGAKRRFTAAQKEQAIKMCADGATLTAAARAVGASITTVSKWVKNSAAADARSSDAVSNATDKPSPE